MGNVILGVPLGGTSGFGVRPYAAGGIGLMRASLSGIDDLFDNLSNNELGFNVGGGIHMFFSDSVGIRADARYFRGLRAATTKAKTSTSRTLIFGAPRLASRSDSASKGECPIRAREQMSPPHGWAPRWFNNPQAVPSTSTAHHLIGRYSGDKHGFRPHGRDNFDARPPNTLLFCGGTNDLVI